MPSKSDPAPIFHIGLHKTGTTWLQTQIFAPEDGRSIIYSEARQDLRGVFSKPTYGAFSPQAARDALAPLLARAREKSVPVLLSDEALAGFPFGDKFRQGVTLQRIHEAFPQARILITIREQTRILHSVYGHYLRGGGTATLEKFLAQPPAEKALIWDPTADLDYYDYARLLSFCQSLFGKNQVVMAPMEWMLAVPQGFLSHISETFALEWQALATSDAKTKVNPAWSDLGYAVCRKLNHMKTGQPRWTMGSWRIKPNALASRIDKFTPAGLRHRQKARQLQIVTDAVGGRYATSNAQLSAELGIDLAAYGYRV